MNVLNNTVNNIYKININNMNSNIFRIEEDSNNELGQTGNNELGQTIVNSEHSQIRNIDNANDTNNSSKKRHSGEGHNSMASITRYLSCGHEKNNSNEENNLNNDEDYKILRGEYLKIIEENSLDESMKIIKKIYVDAIKNAKNALGTEEGGEDYYISIKENGIKTYIVLKNDEFIVVGRTPQCDFSSKNINISRIHAVILNFMDHIYVFDSYSLNGIEILNRSIDTENNMKREPILKFNKNEIGKMSIGFSTTINFTQKRCIICFEREREILFSCNHIVMCNSCYTENNITQCVICKKNIRNIRLNSKLCLNTYVK
jgi:hypothetical protein